MIKFSIKEAVYWDDNLKSSLNKSYYGTYTPSLPRSFGSASARGSRVATSIMAMFIRTTSKPPICFSIQTMAVSKFFKTIDTAHGKERR